MIRKRVDYIRIDKSRETVSIINEIKYFSYKEDNMFKTEIQFDYSGRSYELYYPNSIDILKTDLMMDGKDINLLKPEDLIIIFSLVDIQKQYDIIDDIARGVTDLQQGLEELKEYITIPNKGTPYEDYPFRVKTKEIIHLIKDSGGNITRRVTKMPVPIDYKYSKDYKMMRNMSNDELINYLNSRPFSNRNYFNSIKISKN